jgi:hypothetical protein
MEAPRIDWIFQRVYGLQAQDAGSGMQGTDAIAASDAVRKRSAENEWTELMLSKIQTLTK